SSTTSTRWPSIDERLSAGATTSAAETAASTACWIGLVALSEIGRLMSQLRPVALYWMETSPPCAARLLSIRVVPNPRAEGTCTGGPPLSRHCSRSRRSPLLRTVQVTVRQPSGTEREPYLRALVPNSCSTSAR